MSTLAHVSPSSAAAGEGGCISIIGMAGSGKTTVGRLVAEALGWAFADTDHIIEASYGTRLQTVADAMSKEAFIEMESDVVCSLQLSRAVIATGGSVVYRQRTMAHLASLGPVVFLDVPLETILERIALNPARGLAIAPGQTIEDLFREREALYHRYATVTVAMRGLTPQESAAQVLEALAGQGRV